MDDNEYVFTEDEKGLLDELAIELRELLGRRNVVLQLIIRRRKLQGSWALDEAITKLVKQQ